ncbi:MAG: aspartate aminotransferase family protein [Acidobacteriota bacterium]
MSLTGIGKSTRTEHEDPIVEEEAVGFPGAERSVLFYHDRARLPTVDRAEGIYVYDTDGKRYLDGCSGAVSANLGHGNARMLEAAMEQMSKVAFTYRKQFENEPANQLAGLLAQLSPPELNRVFFVNSGSEAVEAAIKLARQYWWAKHRRGKSHVISTSPSYHGATLGALATTGYAPLNQPFRSMTMHSPKCSAAYCYHCPLGKTYPECGVDCALELERTIDVYGADNIAAFIVEPIGGATTGAAVPPDEYLPMVEEICHENEVLLIVDDVMVGCGRTGTFFGFGHWEITPDIVAMSKGLSGGYAAIGAILATEHIVEPVLEAGGFMHGHTYAGNPLSAAIGLAAVHEILDNHLVDHACDVGTYMHERLHELKSKYPMIGDVRGRGMLAGIEFVRNRETREPFPANWFVALETTEFARNHGLLVYPRRSLHGLKGDHVLVAPPLIIDREGIDDLITRFDRTLNDLQSMLLSYIHEVPEDFDDHTIRRYEQLEEVPAYARGEVEGEPPEDANLTAAMETGHFDPDEHDEVDEE